MDIWTDVEQVVAAAREVPDGGRVFLSLSERSLANGVTVKVAASMRDAYTPVAIVRSEALDRFTRAIADRFGVQQNGFIAFVMLLRNPLHGDCWDLQCGPPALVGCAYAAGFGDLPTLLAEGVERLAERADRWDRPEEEAQSPGREEA